MLHHDSAVVCLYGCAFMRHQAGALECTSRIAFSLGSRVLFRRAMELFAFIFWHFFVRKLLMGRVSGIIFMRKAGIDRLTEFCLSCVVCVSCVSCVVRCRADGERDIDTTTRSLGGTVDVPTTSCGEENLTMVDDRWLAGWLAGLVVGWVGGWLGWWLTG